MCTNKKEKINSYHGNKSSHKYQENYSLLIKVEILGLREMFLYNMDKLKNGFKHRC